MAKMLQREQLPWNPPNDYSYTEKHTVRDWGWEFIRRNPAYIDRWNKVLGYFNKDKAHRIRLYNLGFKSFPDGCNEINPDDYETFIMKFSNHAVQWGLSGFQNPLIEEGLKIPIGAKRHASSRMCVAVIDLEKPLSAQIAAIKERATELQDTISGKTLKKSKREIANSDKLWRNNQKIWKNYIQCIDARALGAKPKELAKTFFSETSNAEGGRPVQWRWDEMQKQIKAIRETGWHSLMF